MTSVITGLAGWVIGSAFAAFVWAVCFRPRPPIVFWTPERLTRDERKD